MRDDQRFEIQRAFDLLPHVVGASWAVIWFRMKGMKNPSRKEYREKVIEYFNLLGDVFDSYPDEDEFKEIKNYIINRKKQEIEKILDGKNKEVEKRYDRYVDYG